MLKWADETRRRLNSTCELDSCSLADDTSSHDLTSNSSSLSLADLTSASKKVTPVLQKRRKAFAKGKRPQSLFVAPEQITLDLEICDAAPITKTASATDLHKLPRQSCSTPSTPEIGIRLKHRRSSVSSLPSESTSNYDTSKTKSKSSSSPGDVLKITTKPELLRITSSNNQDKNSHSFWKNLMNKKSWPTTKSHKKYIQKSTSLTENETYRKTDGECLPVTPIDVDNINISLGLGDMVCSCDLPMNNNVNRKTSLRELKRRSAIKKPKPFNKSMDSDRLSCDRSPDSGYSDNRFSSVSAIASSDDETPPASPPVSIKSTTHDLQAFLKNINESLKNMKVVEQT